MPSIIQSAGGSDTPAIILQTRLGNNIANHQELAVNPNALKLAEAVYRKELGLEFSQLVQRRPASTQHPGVYNCHGLTFGSRRTCIDDEDVMMIIHDDGYGEIEPASVLPGDVILYFRNGMPVHSGIVVSVEKVGRRTVPWVISKWGLWDEFIHKYDVGPSVYQGEYRFFREGTR